MGAYLPVEIQQCAGQCDRSEAQVHEGDRICPGVEPNRESLDNNHIKGAVQQGEYS